MTAKEIDDLRFNAKRRRGTRAEQWGRTAEAQVAAYYVEKGAELIEMRHRNDAGEIDLIVKERETLIFVEVRARKTSAAAAESVDAAKLARIFLAANAYLGAHAPNAEARVDIATVSRAGDITVYENVMLD